MSCTDNSCGTGGWTGPLPGDPDSNVTLSARKVYGGINVSWSWPTVNGHAVAHTILYRGTTNVLANAVEQARVNSSIYYDRVDPVVDTEYFYWIRIVSINGTTSDPVGPVSAIAEPMAQQTLESLTGMIDAGVLAQTLKTDIAGITLLNQALYQEIEDRLAANVHLTTALEAVDGAAGQALTYVNQEIINRTSADGAIVQMVDSIAAGLDEAKAAIIQEQGVRADQYSAMAYRVDTFYVEFDDNKAAVIDELQVLTTVQESTVTSLNALYTTVGNNSSGLVRKVNLLSNDVDAVVDDVTTLAATVGDSNSGIVQKLNATASTTTANASAITTVESAINGNVATGQVGLTTKVNTVTGAVESMYTAKVQSNGLIGGFGIYNNGAQVEAGFDVDLFWVGRTGPDKVKPFIISGSTVYIDKARIKNADIDTLKIAGNSVITGLYAEAGANSVASGGSTVLISRNINLGDTNNSGVVVSGTISCDSSGAVSAGFRIKVNGQVVGDQRASIQAGYAHLFPVSGFADSATGTATVVLEAYSPVGGDFSILSSTMSVMGGKR